jgi:hypothetical protein
VEGGEGFRCSKGVIVCDFVIFSTTPSVLRPETRVERGCVRLIDIVLRHSQRPHHPLSILQLFQQRIVVVLEVFVDDDMGLVVSFCHGDWPSAEDGDAAYALHSEHVVENTCADEAGSACEDEMHAGYGIRV